MHICFPDARIPLLTVVATTGHLVQGFFLILREPSLEGRPQICCGWGDGGGGEGAEVGRGQGADGE